MLILGLETCTPSGGMALLDQPEEGPGRILAASGVVSGRAQSRLLAKSVDGSLRELGLAVGDVDVVAVSNGPGSFTGVRVGLALAKGLCVLPGGPRLVTMSSLEALAWQAYGGEDVDAVVAMHDALRGEVYARIAPVNEVSLSLESAMDKCVAVEALMDLLPRRVLVAGEGALVHRALLEERLEGRIHWARADRMLPDARAVSCLGGKFARDQQWTDALMVGPVYLREPTVKVKER